MRAGHAFWEFDSGQANMSFQHAGEAILLLRSRSADSNGAGDIGGAIQILRT